MTTSPDFDAAVLGILNRAADRYLGSMLANDDECRGPLTCIIGNTALLAASESPEFFEAFIQWLRDFRARYQHPLSTPEHIAGPPCV